jgi:hypothetical protein
MSTTDKKLAISKALENADDKVLDYVYELLCQTDLWGTFSEERKASILRAEDDALNGRVKLHAEVIKQFDAWRGK